MEGSELRKPGEGPPDGDAMERLAGGRAVDVLLAECSALRAEIVSRTTAQAALVGVRVTAVGVVVGLVVQKGANQRLLLALPPLALLVNLLWAIQNRRVSLVADGALLLLFAAAGLAGLLVAGDLVSPGLRRWDWIALIASIVLPVAFAALDTTRR